MKRNWDIDELLEHWSLTPFERELTQNNKTEAGKLGFALLLKWFQHEGLFATYRLEVPGVVLAMLACQLDISVECFSSYK